MELTLKQIQDYIECPVIYHLKYKAKAKIDQSIKAQFGEQMHKAIASFYYNIMNGQIVTPEYMKNKWNQLWAKDLTIQEIIGRDQKDRHRQLQLIGLKMLVNFLETVSSNPGIPICVDEEFRLPVGKHILKGNWELIRETKGKKKKTIVEIVDFKTHHDNSPSWYMAHMDISITAQVYAFRQLFDAKEDRVIYHFLKNSGEYYATRENVDFIKFSKIINNVATCLENDIIYPRVTESCKSCIYQQACYNWERKQQRRENNVEL